MAHGGDTKHPTKLTCHRIDNMHMQQNLLVIEFWEVVIAGVASRFTVATDRCD
jgi:hypothetical protein